MGSSYLLVITKDEKYIGLQILLLSLPSKNVFIKKVGCQILADDCYFVFLSVGFSVMSKQMERN